MGGCYCDFSKSIGTSIIFSRVQRNLYPANNNMNISELAGPAIETDPISSIEAMMRRRGLTQNDLADVFDNSIQAVQILSRELPLTLPMIRVLNKNYSLSASTLIQEYRTINKSV